MALLLKNNIKNILLVLKSSNINVKNLIIIVDIKTYK